MREPSCLGKHLPIRARAGSSCQHPNRACKQTHSTRLQPGSAIGVQANPSRLKAAWVFSKTREASPAKSPGGLGGDHLPIGTQPAEAASGPRRGCQNFVGESAPRVKAAGGTDPAGLRQTRTAEETTRNQGRWLESPTGSEDARHGKGDSDNRQPTSSSTRGARPPNCGATSTVSPAQVP